MKAFEEFAQTMKPHADGARILLELGPDREALEGALEVIRNTGMVLTQYEVLEKGPPMRVLFLLAARDMREVVLKLSEAGYKKIKGINPPHGK